MVKDRVDDSLQKLLYDDVEGHSGVDGALQTVPLQCVYSPPRYVVGTICAVVALIVTASSSFSRVFEKRDQLIASRVFRASEEQYTPSQGDREGSSLRRYGSVHGRPCRAKSESDLVASSSSWKPGRVSSRAMGGGLPTLSTTSSTKSSTSTSGRRSSARLATLDSGIAGAVSGAVSRFIVGPLVRLMPRVWLVRRFWRSPPGAYLPCILAFAPTHVRAPTVINQTINFAGRDEDSFSGAARADLRDGRCHNSTTTVA